VPELFGPAWVAAFKKAIDTSDDYKISSNKWELPVVLVQRADVKQGRPTAQYAYFDLWRGTCREARMGTSLDVERAPVVISADRDVWVQILRGKLELLTALMLRKISIDKGNPSLLVGSVAAMRALVKAAQAASEGFT
jgi:putative sterol carrier protein